MKSQAGRDSELIEFVTSLVSRGPYWFLTIFGTAIAFIHCASVDILKSGSTFTVLKILLIPQALFVILMWGKVSYWFNSRQKGYLRFLIVVFGFALITVVNMGIRNLFPEAEQSRFSMVFLLAWFGWMLAALLASIKTECATH